MNYNIFNFYRNVQSHKLTSRRVDSSLEPSMTSMDDYEIKPIERDKERESSIIG